MDEKNNIGLDTSVLLRLLIGEPVVQFIRVKKYVEQQVKKNKKLLVSDLVISEVYFALQYHYKVPKKEVVRQLNNLLDSGIIQPAPGSVCKEVLKDGKNHKAGIVDQLIYKHYAFFSHEIVSFDKAMGKWGKVKIL